MSELVWELAGAERGARALPLGSRLDVGGPGADWCLASELTGYVVLAHRLGGISVEAAEGVLLEGAPVLRGQQLAPGAALSVGGHVLRLREAGRSRGLPEIPGYRVDSRLGVGGSGEVYAGQRLHDGRAVALKVLAHDADAVTATRFRREVDLLAGLAVPGVAAVLDLLELGPRTVLVRELVEGPTLSARLARGALPEEEALACGVRLAAALGGVHAAGIVHRDVKPANVVLGQLGPTLIDFDLARRCVPAQHLRSLTRLTQSGVGLGSMAYLPPEQLRAAHEADARADVYGLGATLSHALGGELPFANVAPEDFFEALAAGPPPLPPSRFAPGLSAVLARATAPQPDARYADGHAFARALTGCQGWTVTPSCWTLTLAEPPESEPVPEVVAALRDHPEHLRVDLAELSDLSGSETARLVSFLRALLPAVRPPIVLAHAPQATAHTLYKVGLAPKFALDSPRTDRAYPG